MQEQLNNAVIQLQKVAAVIDMAADALNKSDAQIEFEKMVKELSDQWCVSTGVVWALLLDAVKNMQPVCPVERS